MSIIKVMMVGALLGVLLSVLSKVWRAYKAKRQERVPSVMPQKVTCDDEVLVSQVLSQKPSAVNFTSVLGSEIRFSWLQVIPVEAKNSTGLLVLREANGIVHRTLLFVNLQDLGVHSCIKLDECKGSIDATVSASLKEAHEKANIPDVVNFSAALGNEVRISELQVFPVETNKVTGLLILVESNGTVHRILLLLKLLDLSWHSCFKLDDVKGTIKAVAVASHEDALSAANGLFKKRNKKKKAKVQGQSQVQEPAQVLPAQEVTAPAPVREIVVVDAKVPAKALPAVTVPEPAPAPAPEAVIKGYVHMVEGVFVEAGVLEHVNTSKEKAGQTYEAFTVRLNTSYGPDHCTGNDLKRALNRARVEQGDKIKVIHLRDRPLGGKKSMKCYEIINLSKERTPEMAVA